MRGTWRHKKTFCSQVGGVRGASVCWRIKIIIEHIPGTMGAGASEAKFPEAMGSDSKGDGFSGGSLGTWVLGPKVPLLHTEHVS